MPRKSEQHRCSNVDFNHLDEDLAKCFPYQGGLSSQRRPRKPHVSRPPWRLSWGQPVTLSPSWLTACSFTHSTKKYTQLPSSGSSLHVTGRTVLLLTWEQPLHLRTRPLPATLGRTSSLHRYCARPRASRSFPSAHRCCTFSHPPKNRLRYPLWILYPYLATSPCLCSLLKKTLQKRCLHSRPPILCSPGPTSIRLPPTTPPGMLLSRSPSDLRTPGRCQCSTASDTDGPLPPLGTCSLAGWCSTSLSWVSSGLTVLCLGALLHIFLL